MIPSFAIAIAPLLFVGATSLYAFGFAAFLFTDAPSDNSRHGLAPRVPALPTLRDRHGHGGVGVAVGA